MRTSKRKGPWIGASLAAVLSLTGLAVAEETDRPEHSSDPGQSGQAQQGQKTSGIQGSPEQIKELQRELQSRGFYDGKIDGIAGPKTMQGLRNFQSQEGLASTGTLNEETREALGLEWEQQPVAGEEASRPETTPGREATGREREAMPQRGMEPSRVRLSALNEEQAKEMQERLQELGFYRGEIDGKVGPATRSALQRYFQRQAQLASQGMVDDSAVAAFGLEPSEVRRVAGEEQQPSQRQPREQRQEQPTREQPSQPAQPSGEQPSQPTQPSQPSGEQPSQPTQPSQPSGEQPTQPSEEEPRGTEPTEEEQPRERHPSESEERPMR